MHRCVTEVVGVQIVDQGGMNEPEEVQEARVMIRNQLLLSMLSEQGRWDEMGELITPDILKEFAVIGEPETIAGQMKARYGDLVDRTSAAYANIPKDKRLATIRELSA